MIPLVSTGRRATALVRYVMSEGRNRDDELRQAAAGERSRSTVLEIVNQGWRDVRDPEAVEDFRRYIEWSHRPDNQLSRNKTQRTTFQAALSWEPGEQPTHQDMIRAAKSFMEYQGMGESAYMLIRHDDKRHPHVHIVGSRIHPLTGRVFSNWNDRIKAQAWALEWERDNGHVPEARRELHALADAVRARDVHGVVHGLTERDAAFTRGKLDAALYYGGLRDDDPERTRFRNEILQSPELVPLVRSRGKPGEWTTRTVLRQEREVLDMARGMSAPADHDVHVMQLQRFERNLNPEQREALHRVTGPEAFSAISGEAGTGKTRVLQAARDAYQAMGRPVVALATTNQVANDLRKSGFENSHTFDSELYRLRDQNWQRGTVVMVDEAAQLSHDKFQRLFAKANASGAKVVMVGDDHQTPAVKRGGLFTELVREHGSAELKDVMRPRAPEERGRDGVWSRMHRGTVEDYERALDYFERRGAIQWTDKPRQAEAAMARDYMEAQRQDPSKTRMMLHATNAGVQRLNELGRDLAREQGRLGPDVKVNTKDGPLNLAVGDQVVFTGNGRTKAEKVRGFTNGYVGTVSRLDVDAQTKIPRLTVDQGPDRAPLRFALGAGKGQFNAIAHGYASTGYKNQGKTVDETFAAYSPTMQGATAYVMKTRHRDGLHLYADRETAPDVDALAQLMARQDRKHAASAYQIDYASLRDRAGRAATMDAETFARRQAERLAELEPAPEKWRAAERRADFLNRTAAEQPPRQTHANSGNPSSVRQSPQPNNNAPSAASPNVTPQPDVTQSRGGPAPTPRNAPKSQEPRAHVEQPAREGQRISEPSSPSYPPPGNQRAEQSRTDAAPKRRSDTQPMDRALHRDGEPLGGAAHPQGPIQRAQAREQMRATEPPQRPEAPQNAAQRGRQDAPQRHAPGEDIRLNPRPNPEPERPWALRAFREAAEWGNALRRERAFRSRPQDGPQASPGESSRPRAPEQPPESQRAPGRTLASLAAALSGIEAVRDRAISAWSSWRSRPETGVPLRGHADEPRQRHTPTSSPAGSPPAQRAGGPEPSRAPERPTPQPSPQPTPQPSNPIREALDRMPERGPSRGRDGPRR